MFSATFLFCLLGSLQIPVSGTNRFVTKQVWNGTVANLTLISLGSSAPEIMLAINDVIKNGPSTIVRSAAFNLFVIIAVCINAVPDGKTRKIKEPLLSARIQQLTKHSSNSQAVEWKGGEQGWKHTLLVDSCFFVAAFLDVREKRLCELTPGNTTNLARRGWFHAII